jgi:hypothetical protein
MTALLLMAGCAVVEPAPPPVYYGPPGAYYAYPYYPAYRYYGPPFIGIHIR